MTLQEAMEDFLFSKKLAGLEAGSIKNYRATLSLMVSFVGPETPLESVSYSAVTKYILSVYDKPVSKATASSYIRNIRIFFRWASVEHGISFDPLKIKVPKSPKRNVHIYSDSEIRLIFSLVDTSVPWITARNRAIVALMLDSGLRQFEVCGLLYENIDRERQVMKVSGKGAKDRVVPLGRMSAEFLNDYRKKCPYIDSPYVFLDRRGGKLSPNAVRLFVYRLENQLPFKLSSHKLRHNFATNFCIDNMRTKGNTCVYDLSILMGHESIETTKKYEHFAHEIIAAENNISHLDGVFDP